ncbi:MAG: sulfotransferase family protein [Nocardioidaceae bacterium]
MSALRALSRRGRGLPGWVQRFARRALLDLGRVTARWRTRPDFLVIGAQRSGTTTLFRVLSQHPQVLRPTQSKGVGYFDVEYHRGARWYAAHFPLRLTARLHGPATKTFESSGYYAFHPLAARRIAADLPDVKVVMVVRDPVERAYSAHSHELARGFESEDFETALCLESERTAGEADRLSRDEGYVSYAHRHHSYLARGRYVEQLERFGRHLDRDRIYVMDAHRFFDAPAEELARLLDWLGLPAWAPADVGQENARARAPMPAELRARLADHFAPYDAALEDWLGRPPSWRDPR